MLRRREKKSRLRRLADSRELDYFVLLAIGFNAVTMAFPPKMVANADSPKDFFCMSDFVLNIIFVSEFLIKFAAYGLAYFYDAWNLLDFAVVVQGVISLLSDCPNESSAISLPLGDISALRLIRILRPLKSLRKFPEMRLLVASLFTSFNLLLAIIVLLIMAIFVFAVFANFYFRDALDFRCLPDPYYDPFSGTFVGNFHFFVNNENITTNDEYWASDTNYAQYENQIQIHQDVAEDQSNFLATNFWKSLSVYRDYSRDNTPMHKQFPYLASFCGGCNTCKKCAQCYSDDPNDNCDQTISGDFFRKYGHPSRIGKYFSQETPLTKVTRTSTVSDSQISISQPEIVNQLVGVPINHDETPTFLQHSDAASLFNVSYIKEWCVDIKKGETEQEIVVSDGSSIREPLTTPGRNFLFGGWQVLVRFTSRLDLRKSVYARQRSIFRVKNCQKNRGKAKKALSKIQQNEPDSNDFARAMNFRNCRKHYAGKTGNRRAGLLGAQVPRKRRHLWYHRFDAIVWSMLTIFEIMNLESWQDAMWGIQHSVGIYTWPFFYAVIVVINICLLNLFPAVMSFNLRKGIREEENRNAMEAKTKFMGADVAHKLTQFEEHMIDILAAEEEEINTVRNYVLSSASGTASSSNKKASTILDHDIPYEDRGIRCVPRGIIFDTLRRIVLPEAGYFNLFIYSCIFLNIAILSQQQLHARQQPHQKIQHAFDVLNIIFTCIFLAEIVIKVVALGIFGYFLDNFNKFDFILGMLGTIDLLATSIELPGRTLALLRIVRVLRVSRVLRLAQVTKIHNAHIHHDGELDIWRLMNIVSLAGPWIFTILALFFLALYTASIVSMLLFANEVYVLNDYSEHWYESGRLNFDTFPMAFLTNFIVISGDHWHAIMYQTMSKVGGTACIYFILLIIIGKYAILSMLTAIIFEEVERDSIMVIKQGVRTTMLAVFKFEHAIMNVYYRFFFHKWYVAINRRKLGGNELIAEKEGGASGITFIAAPKPSKSKWQKFLENPHSYFLFSPDTHFRKVLNILVASPLFSNIIFVTIIISVILLARFYEIRYQNFAQDKPEMTFVEAQNARPDLLAVQRLCIFIFISEFIIVTIAIGLFKYLSDPMNVLDATITLLSFVSLFVPSLSQFTVLRIIRPMKQLVARSVSLTSLLSSLESSFKGVLAVGLIAAFVWLTIAVIGIQLFQGQLHYCSAARYPEGMLLKTYRPDRHIRFQRGSNKFDNWPDPQFEYYSKLFNEIRTFPQNRSDDNARGCKLKYPTEYEQYNRNDAIIFDIGTFRIKNSDYNFDNLYQALKSAFLTFSFDNWHKLVLATINAKTTGPFLNHQAEANTIVPMFFFFLSGWSSFLIQCLFVGVLYGAFTYRLLVRPGAARNIQNEEDREKEQNNNNSNHRRSISKSKSRMSSRLLLQGTTPPPAALQPKRLASLRDVQWRVYESKLSCIQPLKDPPPISKENMFMKYCNIDPGIIYRHPRYKNVYGFLIFADTILWWIYVGSQITLAPHEQHNEELHDADISSTLRIIRTMDHIFCLILLAEAIIKFATFGSQVNVFTERVRSILLIPVLLYLIFDLTGAWQILKHLDIERNCNDQTGHTCKGAAFQRAIYALRTSQIFLVIPTFVELRTLVYALSSALAITIPMLILMIVATFAFAVIGMIIMGDEGIDKHDDSGNLRIFGNYWPLTRVRFRTIQKAMGTLFISATANSWIEIRDIFENEVSSSERAYLIIFFIIYVLLVRYLFLNVCTMIFIYKFESTSPYQPWIAMDQVNEFLDAWQTFDLRGDGYMKTKYLSRMLRLLSPPLGMAHDVPQVLADRHAKRILNAIPLLLPSEIESGIPDRESRWYHLQLLSEPHNRKGIQREKSLIPSVLPFHQIIKAVHEVVIFSEKQGLPDDDEFTRRREFAQTKLDVLRLAVFRFILMNTSRQSTHETASHATSLPKKNGSIPSVSGGGTRSEQALNDMSLMQRLTPNVFRYRLRQALTLETHRWQKQIELSKFDEESYHECELLLNIVREECRSARWQLEILDKLAAKGILNLLQERRPKLHRHIAFLHILLRKIQAERRLHIQRSWQPSSIMHQGTLPVAPRINAQTKIQKRALTNIVASSSGDILISAHGGTTITVWKRRRNKKKNKQIKTNDPWKISPYYKIQIENESNAPVLALAMTKDGRRFYVSIGSTIKCFIRSKKGKVFVCESIMLGHTGNINKLQVYKSHLFSISDDGTIKIWQLRSSEPLQSAQISYTNACHTFTLFNTTPAGEKEDIYSSCCIAGDESGRIHILPFQLRAQWLQGTVWSPTKSEYIFNGGEAVTAAKYEYHRLFIGSATGCIEVFRTIRGDQDKYTLEYIAEALKRRGVKIANINKLGVQAAELIDKQTAMRLSEVVRIEHMYSLSCHSAAISDFCIAGGIFFSAARDMALIGWHKPNNVEQGSGLGKNKNKGQAYTVARIYHKTPITAMTVAGNSLVTGDEDGYIILQTAQKYREIIEHGLPRKLSSAQLELEVIEKPRFFSTNELSTMKPRHFLAQILAHYYPRHSLYKKLGPNADDDEFSESEEESDDDLNAPLISTKTLPDAEEDDEDDDDDDEENDEDQENDDDEKVLSAKEQAAAKKAFAIKQAGIGAKKKPATSTSSKKGSTTKKTKKSSSASTTSSKDISSFFSSK
mmetsp:Transcript_10606/g.16013  ORF Transcript_10606/g.16013 Transcript_10606/m.16013 type:complete len:2657 (+) Transcript_10606:55-8025(+)